MGRIWCRLYAGTRNHRKITALRNLEPELWRVWYTLLEMACECDDGGWVYLAPGIPFSYKQLAKEFGVRRQDTVKRVLRAMMAVGLIVLSGYEEDSKCPGSDHEVGAKCTGSEVGVLVKGFLKRQYESGTSAERTRKYRERKKSAQENGCHGDGGVTPQNRTETETEQNTPIPPSPGVESVSPEKVRLPYSDDFLAFYAAYPNKKGGKDAAWTKWERRRLKGTLPTIEALTLAVEKLKYSPGWLKEEGKFIPHVTTFINRGQWSDAESLPKPPPNRKPPDPNCPICNGRGLELFKKGGFDCTRDCSCRK
jgi:hypothetical protein